MEYNIPYKSEINTQKHELSTLPEEQYLEDCNSTGSQPEFSAKESQISFKPNGEKYFPHFKAKVISYALKHSIKNAALTFKVNKDTVSAWVYQSKPSLAQSNCKLLACLIEEDSGPDQKFIQWLRTSEKNNILSRQLLIEKVNELVNSYEKEEPNKQNMWFFLYAKRLKDEKPVDKIKIKYPYLFKQEIVSYTNHFSKKKISKIFNIDRKRICEWTSDFKNEKLKKRDVSKYLTDPEVDSKIWEWYCLQQNKPSGKEVRLKAARLYEEAGFSQIRCSPGWYYRWRVRHHLPPVRISQASRDSELLAWVLTQIDDNRAILHSDLLKQASLFKGSDFKASSSWVFRFTKRYISHIQSGSEHIILPRKLSQQVDDFKKLVSGVILKNNIQPKNIVAFDEFPINFNYSDTGRNDNVVGKSEWATCQASVILCCSADGSLHSTGLILKTELDESIQVFEEIKPVLVQQSGVNDRYTIGKWFDIIKRTFGSPSILVCDTYDPHKHLKTICIEEYTERNIELMIIPGGCSSHLQPILFGLSKKFQVEMDNYFERWHHESRLSGTVYRLPSNDDIYKWVMKAHNTLASSCKDLIKHSFVKAGIIDQI